jgi:serine/threonine protein kinase
LFGLVKERRIVVFDFSNVTLQRVFDAVKGQPLAVDFFGDIPGDAKVQIEELSARYRKLVVVCHPDIYRCESPAIYAMASETTRIINALREEAKAKIEEGTYGQRLSGSKSSVIEFDTKRGKYCFTDQNSFDGKVVFLRYGDFVAYNGDHIRVVAKNAKDSRDNDLLKKEAKIFKEFEDPNYPILLDIISEEGKIGLIMRYSPGVDLRTLKRESRPHGLEPKHVAWIILEALFSLGSIHTKKIIHGSIAMNNTILDLAGRRIYFCDFFYAANTSKDSERITGLIDGFSAPEVYRKEKPVPGMDIYSIGKLAIDLLGGSVTSKSMPDGVPQKMRELIGLMVEEDWRRRPDDAWKLCERWDLLCERLFGADYRKAAWAV